MSIINAWIIDPITRIVLQYLSDQFAQINQKLDSLSTKVDQITQGELKMAATLDSVLADVTAEKDVVDSAVTLLGQLKTQLDAAIASGDLTKVQAISDAIGAQKQELADAVAANTPAAPANP